MIKLFIFFILITLIIFLFIKRKELFDGITDLEGIDKNGVFVNLYDNNGRKLNVTLIAQPFGSDNTFKQYLVNKPKKIYLGISSYMEFPGIPSNPEDNYIDIKDKIKNADNKQNSHYMDMYNEICEGWLHCFRNPKKYITINKPLALISESDFVDYKSLTPDNNIVKEFDYIYSCPKVNEKSHCNDWVSYNKNWGLAEKCIKIMSDMGLRGLLIGRKGCNVPPNCEATGWIDYGEMKSLYNKCKFVFIPNIVDASPRFLTEGLSMNLSCLVNKNILGGWKYVSEKTGEFFTDENDIKDSVQRLIQNMKYHSPRQYIIDNYGPVNSGKKLKEFLYKNFKNRINLPEEEVEYITIRFPKVNYKT
jgi:hypothetical protein